MVAVDEAEPLVERACVRPLPVGGELRQMAAPGPRTLDRGPDQDPAEPGAAVPSVDAHALDLRAQAAAVRQATEEAQLQHARDRAVELEDEDLLLRVQRDLAEGGAIRLEVVAALALRAESASCSRRTMASRSASLASRTVLMTLP